MTRLQPVNLNNNRVHLKQMVQRSTNLTELSVIFQVCLKDGVVRLVMIAHLGLAIVDQLACADAVRQHCVIFQ
jgi:hypothetical protein